MATQITTVGGFDATDNNVSTNLLSNFYVDGQLGDDTITVSEAASAFTLKGSGGEDVIIFDSDISDVGEIKGNADDDTFNIKGAATNTTLFGGKGADSITFRRTLVGGLVSGDTGADIVTLEDKVSDGASLTGGSGDDTFIFESRLDSSTVKGGDSRDSVDLQGNTSDSFVSLGSDDDKLSIVGKHSSLKVKGGANDDSFAIGAITGSGNKFYAGKGEDTINISSTAALGVYADNDDDTIAYTAVKAVGASIYGGEGIDTINLKLTQNLSTLFVKGNSGDDDIDGSNNNAAETIFGGQGNDTITHTSAASARNYYGDKGDDVLTVISTVASLIDGGIGADAITMSAAAAAGTKAPHSIDGGAGADTITLSAGVALATNANKYNAVAIADTNHKLYYDSFAEFFSGGDLADTISITDAQAAIAVVSEELTVNDSDTFVRVATGGADRNAVTEGLLIQTGSSVTSGSSVVFAADADDEIAGVDLSAGTTGSSVLNNSAGTGLGMLLIGGSGKNTVKGGAGADVLEGGAKNDVLEGNASADVIYGGAGGNDSILGGTGGDSIYMKSDLDRLDTIVGGDATGDTLIFKDANGEATDLNGVTQIGAVILENTTTDASVTLLDGTVASGATMSFDASSINDASYDLLFNATAELDGIVSVEGGVGADSITGGSGDDTIIGGGGGDSLLGGSGTDSIIGGAGADVMTATGTNTFEFDVAGGDSGITSTTADTINAFTLTTNANAGGEAIGDILDLDGATAAIGTTTSDANVSTVTNGKIGFADATVGLGNLITDAFTTLAGNGEATFFVDSGDTYVVYEGSGSDGLIVIPGVDATRLHLTGTLAGTIAADQLVLA